MTKKIFIFILLFIIVASLLFPKIETFSNLQQSYGQYPNSVDKAILNDYPLIGKNKLSNDNSIDIWKYYPMYQVGSYSQQTNNLRYFDNPDIGTCTPTDFCGALYHDKKSKHSNIITPLPPVQQMDNAVRVNYYNAKN
jgi:hypothetical protein